jgi:hypothetical protein
VVFAPTEDGADEGATSKMYLRNGCLWSIIPDVKFMLAKPGYRVSPWVLVRLVAEQDRVREPRGRATLF